MSDTEKQCPHCGEWLEFDEDVAVGIANDVYTLSTRCDTCKTRLILSVLVGVSVRVAPSKAQEGL